MAQVNHGLGHRVEQPVKVKDGFHVGARQHQHDDPTSRLVPNGPPRRDVGPQRAPRRKRRLKTKQPANGGGDYT